MRRSVRKFVASVGFAGLVSAFAPAPAASEDAKLSMLLTCSGQDQVYKQVGQTTTTTVVPGVAPNVGSDALKAAVSAQTATTRSSTSPEFGFVTVPGRLSLAIDGSAVRIRPSAQTAPRKRSSDGWYDLIDVVITENAISAKATWGTFSKPKLEVDRRTGDVKFGNFRGACEKTADAADAKKF